MPRSAKSKYTQKIGSRHVSYILNSSLVINALLSPFYCYNSIVILCIYVLRYKQVN